MKKYSLYSSYILLLAIFTTTAFCPVQSNAGENDIRQSMVKIYATQLAPDYQNPWRLNDAIRVSGSGCVIANKFIITNAHVVSNQTFIQVRSFGKSEKYKADVFAVSHEADLALLTVSDKSFFNDISPLPFDDLPELQDNVFVYGFPEGGDNLSITKGVVSRIEHRVYTHSSENFLAIQIDAAVNSGNSGGPVISNGKIVAVVMQAMENAQNTSYAVPVPIIQHFLKDMEDGNYDGFPKLAIAIQELENNSLKKRFGLPEDQTGILVTDVMDESTTGGLLRKYDILLKINGHPIADDGTVEFRPNERTNADYYIEQYQIGQQANIELFREKERKQVRIKMATGQYFQVFRKQYDTRPHYFIFGGLVFSPLTMNFLHLYGENWTDDAPINLLYSAMYGYWKEDKKEIVTIIKVLPHDINIGYHNMYDEIVEEVNGVPIRDLAHLNSLIYKGSESLIELKLRDGGLIVIDREEAEKTHDSLLKQYGVVN